MATKKGGKKVVEPRQCWIVTSNFGGSFVVDSRTSADGWRGIGWYVTPAMAVPVAGYHPPRAKKGARRGK